MINGVRGVIFSSDPEADRAFFRDVFEGMLDPTHLSLGRSP